METFFVGVQFVVYLSLSAIFLGSIVHAACHARAAYPRAPLLPMHYLDPAAHSKERAEETRTPDRGVALSPTLAGYEKYLSAGGRTSLVVWMRNRDPELPRDLPEIPLPMQLFRRGTKLSGTPILDILYSTNAAHTADVQLILAAEDAISKYEHVKPSPKPSASNSGAVDSGADSVESDSSSESDSESESDSGSGLAPVQSNHPELGRTHTHARQTESPLQQMMVDDEPPYRCVVMGAPDAVLRALAAPPRFSANLTDDTLTYADVSARHKKGLAELLFEIVAQAHTRGTPLPVFVELLTASEAARSDFIIYGWNIFLHMLHFHHVWQTRTRESIRSIALSVIMLRPTFRAAVVAMLACETNMVHLLVPLWVTHGAAAYSRLYKSLMDAQPLDIVAGSPMVTVKNVRNAADLVHTYLTHGADVMQDSERDELLMISSYASEYVELYDTSRTEHGGVISEADIRNSSVRYASIWEDIGVLATEYRGISTDYIPHSIIHWYLTMMDTGHLNDTTNFFFQSASRRIYMMLQNDRTFWFAMSTPPPPRILSVYVEGVKHTNMFVMMTAVEPYVIKFDSRVNVDKIPPEVCGMLVSVGEFLLSVCEHYMDSVWSQADARTNMCEKNTHVTLADAYTHTMNCVRFVTMKWPEMNFVELSRRCAEECNRRDQVHMMYMVTMALLPRVVSIFVYANARAAHGKQTNAPVQVYAKDSVFSICLGGKKR